jgi:hypothetical protein
LKGVKNNRRASRVAIGTAVAVLLTGLGAVAATPAPAAGLTDEQIAKIRDGFDARVKAAFEAHRGKPLVRAEKRAPLREGAGNYVRHYSYSIVEFATRCFLLNEQIAEANAALIENAQHYLDNPNDLNDRDSFHWHSEMLCRLIDFYGARGSRAAGRMTAEAEARVMESLARYAARNATLKGAEIAKSRTWHLHESENHHAQNVTSFWHFSRLARTRPGFRNFKYSDGSTPEQQHAAWTAYLKAYCAERGKKGLFIEVGSENYNLVTLKGFHNVLDFAEDPELRRKAAALLDLYWATWAQEQIGGVLGGGKSRIYQNAADRVGTHSEIYTLAWFYFGIGEAADIQSPLLTSLTGSYRPPLVVVDLALDVAGRGRYAIHHRAVGLVEKGYDNAPDYRLLPDAGGIHRYSWCTPAFILGTSMLEARPVQDWARISCQNRWHGVIFAGHPNARIVPQVQARDHRTAVNTQWSAQSQGTMICQKLKASKDSGTMRVWFSKDGLTKPVEENGWVFVESPGAHAAVRVVKGAAAWENPSDRHEGSWLRCAEPFTPVILEVAPKSDFPNAAAFRAAVRAVPIQHKSDVLTYRGRGGDAFTFYTDHSKPPRINGKPVDYSPPNAFDSPFVQGAWNSGVVTIRKGNRSLRLDFR